MIKVIVVLVDIFVRVVVFLLIFLLILVFKDWCLMVNGVVKVREDCILILIRIFCVMVVKFVLL